MILPEMVPRFNETIKEIAGQRAVIDLNEHTGPNLTTDGIHLNAQGYTLWTTREGLRLQRLN
jgi:lysophospholipase L1-like esterase